MDKVTVTHFPPLHSFEGVFAHAAKRGVSLEFDADEAEFLAQVIRHHGERARQAEEQIKLLREALEAALDGLERASRTLTDECKVALNGKPWGGLLIEQARQALGATNG